MCRRRRMQACAVALPRSRTAKATLRHGHVSRRAGARHGRSSGSTRKAEDGLRRSGSPERENDREAEGEAERCERGMAWRGWDGAVAEARDANLTAFCRIEGAISNVAKKGEVQESGWVTKLVPCIQTQRAYSH